MQSPQPAALIGPGTDPAISIDTVDAAQTMRSDFKISDTGIADATIYLDAKNRWLNYGTHYPNWLGRHRFYFIPELANAPGDIVRISTRVRGKDRTAEEMNGTLMHELEHLAQEDRKDSNLREGRIAIWGLAAAGAVIANRLGRTKKAKALGTAFGGYVGHSLGYMIAPHERQARAKARQVKATAIKRG